MQYFLAFLMIIAAPFAHASTVDSLLQRLQQLEKQCSSPCAQDTVKVMVLNDISRKLMTQHPDSANMPLGQWLWPNKRIISAGLPTPSIPPA